MSFWSRFSCFDHVFYTPLSVEACRDILAEPETCCGDLLNPGRVRSVPLDDGRYMLTFLGQRFGKARRTEFIADIHVEGTIILKFHRELLGFPPMTPLQEITRYMADKFNATHENTT